jgi:putative acetyltransferase
MDNYTLRPLTTSDYDVVYALWQKSEGMGLSDSDSREAIAAFLERNCGLSTVACSPDGQIVGAVLCGHDGRRGYLHHLAVALSCRKRGIGRALVNECLTKLASLKIQKANLFLFASHAAGRTFWLKQGWTAREDIVLVQKVLKPDSGAKRCSC